MASSICRSSIMKSLSAAAGASLLLVASCLAFAQSTETNTKAVEKEPVAAGNLSETAVKRLTRGYKAAFRQGVQYYCRDEVPIGTRLAVRKCWTIDQLAEIERDRVDTQKRLERKVYERPTDVG